MDMPISRERIGDEIVKSISEAKSIADYFRFMTETKAIYAITPEFIGMETTFHGNNGSHYGESVYQHILDVSTRLEPRLKSVSKEEKVILTLATYFHDIGKMLTVKNEGGRISFLGHEDVSTKITEYRLNTLVGGFPKGKRLIRPAVKLISLHMKLNEMARNGPTLPRKQFARMFVFDFNGNYVQEQGNLSQLMALCEADQNGPLYFAHDSHGYFTFDQPIIKGEEAKAARITLKPAVTGICNDIADPQFGQKIVIEPAITAPAPDRIRGDLIKQMWWLQLSQNLDRAELKKRLNGEANNIVDGGKNSK